MQFASQAPPTERVLLFALLVMTGVVFLADYFGPEREEHPPRWVGGLLVVLILAAAAEITRSLHNMSGHATAVLPHLAQVPIGLLLAVALCGGGILLIQRLGTPSLRRVTTHGSAAWATSKDLQGLLAPAGRPPVPGALLLAPYGRKAIVLPPEFAQRHTLIVGGTGSGKTRGSFCRTRRG